MNPNQNTTQYIIEKASGNFEKHLSELENIYISNGWGSHYPKSMLRKMFLNSYHLIAVSANGAIGFLRALTDGICVTHLSEVLVLPKYQNTGIGIEDYYYYEKVFHNRMVTIIYENNLFQPALENVFQ